MIATRFGPRSTVRVLPSRDATDVVALDGSNPPIVYKCRHKELGHAPVSVAWAYEHCKHLRHPNISCILDVGRDGECHFLVEWREEGDDLVSAVENLAGKLHAMPSDQVLHITKSILRGLSYLHAQRLVHRDIKCENIVLSGALPTAPGGTMPSVRLTDWEYLAPPGKMNGVSTVAYGSPHAHEGKPYSKTDDMWSFGVVLYILLMGYPPFTRPKPSHIHSLFPVVRADGVALPEPAKDLLSRIFSPFHRNAVPSAHEVLLGPLLSLSPAQLDDLRFAKVSEGKRVTTYRAVHNAPATGAR